MPRAAHAVSRPAPRVQIVPTPTTRRAPAVRPAPLPDALTLDTAAVAEMETHAAGRWAHLAHADPTAFRRALGTTVAWLTALGRRLIVRAEVQAPRLPDAVRAAVQDAGGRIGAVATRLVGLGDVPRAIRAGLLAGLAKDLGRAWTTLRAAAQAPVLAPLALRPRDSAGARALLEGVPTLLVGFHPDDPDDVARLAVLRAGLRIYRRRVAAVLPWLTTHQPPLEARFDQPCFADDDALFAARGLYGVYFYPHETTDRRIALCLANVHLERGAERLAHDVAHTLAHEGGHHVWRTLLSGASRRRWTEVVDADRFDREVPARDLLAAWDRTGLPRDASVAALAGTDLAAVDPVNDLWLRLYARTVHPMPVATALAKRLARWPDATVRVTAHPITVYADTSPEEAFCEAFGRLVTHGPKAVLSPVRAWLTSVLPELRGATAAFRRGRATPRRRA